ncbi:MAG: alpha/beta hydrolase [Xanthomonadales bacterium]|nr:alpha/beta hydrolase [Xanthomonadales bacterium]
MSRRDSGLMRRPSALLFALESRAVYDAAAMVPVFPLQRLLPRGDGHPVLVLPGFLTSSYSTIPLRRLLRRLGYAAHRWKLGRNLGYSEELRDRMLDRVLELTERYERTVSLVGWSLGGVYARELARERPELVRLVISMGSPFRIHLRHDSVQPGVHQIYRLLNGDGHFEDADLVSSLAEPPPVPTSALFTKGDGVVHWESTVENSDRPDVENIHVGGAHMGLGFNPRSMIAIADRLSQPEGDWRPFNPRGLLKLAYRNYMPEWLVGR